MNPRSGLTIIELSISMLLLVIVGFKVSLLLGLVAEADQESTARIVLEDQAMRLLDQVSFAVMGANRETLFPEPESPTYTEFVTYEVSLGVEDGAVVWGDKEEIKMSAQDGQVVWLSKPGEVDELRVVWSNIVRPLLGGELPNGIDDNGNGLVDESGLNFTLQGNTVRIRLTLERTDAGGGLADESVETRVTLRN
jgi:hypothetical protein